MTPACPRQGRIQLGIALSAKRHEASLREREEPRRHRRVCYPLPWRRELGDDFAAIRHQDPFAGSNLPNVLAQPILQLADTYSLHDR